MKGLLLLLVEDSALFASALHNTLFGKKGCVLTVCSSKSFLKTMTKSKQDIVVIDAVTWSANSPPLIDAVRQAARTTPVIILGREDFADRHAGALRAGAVAFVKQTASPRLLSKVLNVVAAGDTWFDRKVFQKVFGEVDVPHPRLTQREQQVLSLVANGKSNKEVAALVGLKERSVKAHVSNLFRKTGVSNRSGLTSYAITRGLAQPAF